LDQFPAGFRKFRESPKLAGFKERQWLGGTLMRKCDPEGGQR
jgi:hypothetical protein